MRYSLLPAFVALTGLLSLSCPAATTYTTIALSGTEAPDETGSGSGDDFDWFNDIVINSTGQVALRAGLAWSLVVDSDNDSGLWTDTTGSLKLLAREGDPAPDTSADFRELIASGANPAIADTGDVAFRSRLVVGGTSIATIYTDFGVWTGAEYPGDLTLVVRQGDDAPDEIPSATGATFALSRTFPVISDATGSVAFYSRLFVNQAGSNATSYDNVGIWFWEKTAEELSQVARTDAIFDVDFDAPLGVITGKKFGRFPGSPVLGGTASDTIGYAAGLRPEPKLDEFEDPIEDRVTTANKSGIWAGAPGAITDKFVRGGDAADAGIFRAFYPPDVNASGTLAFRGTLTTSGSAPTASKLDNVGIWKKGATIQRIARKGQTAAPGLPSTTFRRFRYDPVISDTGVVAFLAEANFATGVDKDNDTGIWKGATDTLSAVAIEGSDATDATGASLILPSDLVNAATFFKFSAPSINQNGQVAFLAQINRSPTGLTSAENQGIWAQRSTDDTLLLIARRGGTLAGKTVATLRMVSGSGGSDGRPRGWVYDSSAAKGKLAFIATFTDGTKGAFVATVD